MIVPAVLMALAGCGATPVQGGLHRQSSADSTHHDSANPIAQPAVFQEVNYTAAIYNVGERWPFVVFDEQTGTVEVGPMSLAHERIIVAEPSLFASKQARANWRANGSPGVLLSPSDPPREGDVPHFSFLGQGVPLGYEEARNLSSDPQTLEQEVARHVSPRSPRRPSARRMLEAYGLLLGRAPLTPGVRNAMYVDTRHVAGARGCGEDTDLLGRRGPGVCVKGEGMTVELLLDRRTRAVLAVEQRLAARSPLYPGLRPGTLVESRMIVRARSPH
jgi:hypothetical protein